MVQEESRLIIKRIAFTLVGGRNWTGGYYYLLNLIRAINSHAADRLTPLLFVGNDGPEDDIAPFREIDALEIVRSSTFDAEQNRVRLVQAALLGVDHAAARSFRQHAVDVVFEPATFYGWRFPIPAISWLSDFQHRHLPHLFGAKAYWKRELGFRAQVASGRLVMVSSEDARQDCERFYPSCKGRTAVVRFAVPADTASLALNPTHVARQYDLPEHFYYLPNQFWKHKNHRIVIDALARLGEKGCDIVVAASGKSGDTRHPQHYDSLKSLVISRGLTRNFRFLGMVPRPHVVALMRACTALINPSLFEGWSTTVEEAKTLGVPMLLSDLCVHKEQAGGLAYFFDPNSATELATLLMTHSKLSASARRNAEKSAIEASYINVKQFSSDFVRTVERVTDSSGEAR